MGRDDLANDRQAQPGAAGVPVDGNAIELLEDAGDVFGGDALAGVANDEPRALAVGDVRRRWIEPPRGVCWIAFMIRLSKTCSIRSRSTMTVRCVAVSSAVRAMTPRPAPAAGTA